MTITIITAEQRSRGCRRSYERTIQNCIDCGNPYSVACNMRKRSLRCPKCRMDYRREYKRAGRVRGIVSGTAFGGPYRVLHDPCDTFGYNSSFSRSEIDDMLKFGYLAIGTVFQRNGSRYVVEPCCDDGLVLRRVEASQLPPAKAGGLPFQISSHEETEV